MKKWILGITGGIAAIFIIMVATAAIMLATFDPNSHKERIASLVKEKTGRDLSIAGDINVSFFPILGFEAKGIQLGNPAGFKDKDFINVGTASAGVKLIPLLTRQIEITDIILQEPQIHIIKKQDGTTNLALSDAPSEEKKDTVFQGLSIESIQISDGRVIYADNLSGKRYMVDPLNMTIPGLSKAQATKFTMDMVLKSDASPKNDTSVKFESDIKADTTAGLYELTGFKGYAILQPKPDQDKIRVSFSGDSQINARSETAMFKNLQVTWPDDASAKHSEAKGELSLKGFKKPDVTFTLSMSKLNLDRFMGENEKRDTPKDAALPTDMLRDFNVDGNITMGELEVAGYRATDIIIKILSRNGLMTIDPLRMNAYGGTEQSRITLDARKNTPELKITGEARNIQLGTLLLEKTLNDYVTGTLNTNYTLSSAGNSMEALQRNLGGTIGVNLSDGMINKWQLSKLLNRAITFFETGKITENASDNFRFTSLDANWTGENGVFRNNDLVLIAPASHVLGGGLVNLRDQTVDYSLGVGLGDDPSAFEQAKRLPINIQGPLGSPGYSLDFEAIAAQKLKGSLKDVLEKELGAQEPAAGEETEKNTPSPSGVLKQLLNGK